ncbi:hypothetical protein [Streptomyces lonarensis]|uniref:Uncharacterized protein n=1 Tax=Streptomyces lonarensis TaxID=700599 RepID=A0A7X6HXK6_9ACTN|nr:hypothetical protein [Streptomyces lonarensis]NJQ04274.1 hypothetical protein [Streptomyces lonarensis]
MTPERGTTPARRTGRPKGPPRRQTTVRILASHDRQLTAAVERTGLNVQGVIEAALDEWFLRNDIPDPGPPAEE